MTRTGSWAPFAGGGGGGSACELAGQMDPLEGGCDLNAVGGRNGVSGMVSKAALKPVQEGLILV